jgi:P27 family predicted phage terminase small subunit
MPVGLSVAAQREWNDIVPQLEKLGILSRIDGKALAAYCHAFARWWEAEQHITEHGLVVEEPIFDAAGQEIGTRFKKNPAVGISRDAMRDMKSFLIEFGMTPAARSRIRVENPKEKLDHFEQYLTDSDTVTRPN